MVTKFTVIYACEDSPVSAGDVIEAKINTAFDCDICEDTGVMPNGWGTGEMCGGWGDVCDCQQQRDEDNATYNSEIAQGVGL